MADDFELLGFKSVARHLCAVPVLRSEHGHTRLSLPVPVVESLPGIVKWLSETPLAQSLESSQLLCTFAPCHLRQADDVVDSGAGEVHMAYVVLVPQVRVAL